MKSPFMSGAVVVFVEDESHLYFYQYSIMDALQLRMGSEWTLSWFDHGCSAARNGSEWALSWLDH